MNRTNFRLPMFFAPDDGGAAAVADKAAADTAAADTAAAEKAAADKAAADKAAADAAAAAGKTPEQLAADKAAEDAEIARKAGETPKAPEKYELTLPEEQNHLSDVDLQFIAGEAKALGLTQEQAQTLVTVRNVALAEQSARFLSEAKADPEIGGAKWDNTVKHAQAGVTAAIELTRRTVGLTAEEETQVREMFFDRTGIGNHRLFLKMFFALGRATAEDTPIRGTKQNTERKDTADVLYPKTAAAS